METITYICFRQEPPTASTGLQWIRLASVDVRDKAHADELLTERHVIHGKGWNWCLMGHQRWLDHCKELKIRPRDWREANEPLP